MCNKIFKIGETVYWLTGSMFNEGVVRDDLGKETVNVLLVSINDKKASKKVNPKRELLTRKTKGMDVKKQLVFTKFKAYSANQIIAKIEKKNYTELELVVFKEILLKRGKTAEEIEAIVKASVDGVKVEAPKAETTKKDALKTEKIKVTKAGAKKEEVKMEVVKKEGGLPETKTVSKKVGNSTVVELNPDDEKTEDKVEDKPKGEDKPKAKSTSKSITLEESEEVKGLKTGAKVTFKPSARLKVDGDITGEIKRIYKCHKANFKEFCQIKGDDGKVYYKRANVFAK